MLALTRRDGTEKNQAVMFPADRKDKLSAYKELKRTGLIARLGSSPNELVEVRSS